jgi:hypothetical protein
MILDHISQTEISTILTDVTCATSDDAMTSQGQGAIARWLAAVARGAHVRLEAHMYPYAL